MDDLSFLVGAVLALAVGAWKSFVLISDQNACDALILAAIVCPSYLTLVLLLDDRINKRGSQKDEEQKKNGNYFFYDDGADDEEDIDDFDL